LIHHKLFTFQKLAKLGAVLQTVPMMLKFHLKFLRIGRKPLLIVSGVFVTLSLLQWRIAREIFLNRCKSVEEAKAKHALESFYPF